MVLSCPSRVARASLSGMGTRIGELAALLTAVSWTFTAFAFAFAARRIGSLALNVLRLTVALLLFAVLGLVLRGEPFPLAAPSSVWFWLSLSGLAGFVFGDLFLFQAYIDLGARLTQVVFASAPLMTAIIGRLALGETIGPPGILGMIVVICGIAMVVAKKPGDASSTKEPVHPHRARGVVFALLAALGQAGGLVLSKIGAPHFDPFAATQIRVIAGLAGFLVVAAVWRRFREPWRALKDRKALGILSVGAFFGPFLGVSMGLFAVQRTGAGAAATLMGLTPILILVPALFHQQGKNQADGVPGRHRRRFRNRAAVFVLNALAATWSARI